MYKPPGVGLLRFAHEEVNVNDASWTSDATFSRDSKLSWEAGGDKRGATSPFISLIV